jgi:hypothetical protein
VILRRQKAIYGLLAEFEHAEEVVEAAQKAYAEGYRRLDAYSPYPVEGLPEAIGFRRSRVPLITLIGGLIGGSGAFFMCCYPNVWGYPLNIGGRPYYSWPMFIPITFELTVLFSALFCVFGMFALDGLPMPYHPVFSASHFAQASQDRFFLLLESRDANFDLVRTREFLEGFHPHEITEIRS